MLNPIIRHMPRQCKAAHGVIKRTRRAIPNLRCRFALGRYLLLMLSVIQKTSH